MGVIARAYPQPNPVCVPLRLIESYGTGIRRIFHLYKGCPVPPEIHVPSHAFRLVLPNQNRNPSELSQSSTGAPQAGRNPQQLMILKAIQENGFITEPQVMELLHVKKTRAHTILREMLHSGLLVATGRGVTKKYLIRG